MKTFNEWVPGQDRRAFVKYLQETLIPDLKESGSLAMAEDFEEAVEFIKDGVLANRKNAMEFVRYLQDTLIPDLKESGSLATAEDFETAVSLIKVGSNK
jgi:hypothetical protein